VEKRIGALPWINRRFLSRVKAAAEIGGNAPLVREQRKLAAIPLRTLLDTPPDGERRERHAGMSPAGAGATFRIGVIGGGLDREVLGISAPVTALGSRLWCRIIDANEARICDVAAAHAEHHRKDVSALAIIASTLTGCVRSNWPTDRIRT